MIRKPFTLWFHFFDVLLNIVIIVAVVAGIRTFLVSPFQVEGNSMIDTLENRQYIIINKLVYFLNKPGRGDVVVFRPPNTDHSKHYVKRIIGEPGDEIIIRNGSVFVRVGGKDKERQVAEPYLNDRNQDHTYVGAAGSGEEKRYPVPAGHYFLLGDNRLGSLDSRSFRNAQNEPTPFVPEDDIKGRVWFVALPLSKAHAMEAPEYGF
ncbi:MAG: signal peptidase I [Candidatus Peribacter riflensis]|uniref:Signal peptidase I n=1 Tax=Candidatus Peribacter riflensis TaxID=1735162 RepID=A0A0S1SNQ1_9BACT|nr:MAG: signal peptidase I [Candidatus Peribacter riflensis]OGJ77032.1 MAG: signal peptidase I [Candidatus Peribacteria bacterium RIFOXYB1_FULL_57_12]OGJ80881.1 MAG: signal peptidase I [Candidatus Peribacteria bacterium RIFOXYC1_FULL_58_8]ALM10975.1 MAG: signal peptidase I [Candidatus Peribacter riflensis]ALM12078.1 MAG: signal peptidase I [Candidatus Peribacter riflensis]